MSEQLLQQIHTGAKKLIEIASQNDPAGLLFNNTALSNGMKALARLHELSKAGKTKEILEDVQLSSVKSEQVFFLQYTSAFVNMLHGWKAKGKRVEITDYDYFVLMAAAETLSEIMWQDKKEVDIPGPVLKECLEEYAFQDLNTILQVFVKNYIGNILQHLFEAGKVRMANPKLDPATEVDLKEKDAAAISGYTLSGLITGNSQEVDIAQIVRKLNLARKLILSKS